MILFEVSVMNGMSATTQLSPPVDGVTLLSGKELD